MKKLILIFLFLFPLLVFSQVKWQEVSVNTGLLNSAKDDKIVFLNFYAEWCGPCQYMDTNIFTNENLYKFMNDTLIPIRVNIDDNDDLVLKYKIKSFPTYLILDNGGDEIGRISGTTNSPQLFKEELTKILENAESIDLLLLRLKNSPKNIQLVQKIITKYFFKKDISNVRSYYNYLVKIIPQTSHKDLVPYKKMIIDLLMENMNYYEVIRESDEILDLDSSKDLKEKIFSYKSTAYHNLGNFKMAFFMLQSLLDVVEPEFKYSNYYMAILYLHSNFTFLKDEAKNYIYLYFREGLESSKLSVIKPDINFFLVPTLILKKINELKNALIICDEGLKAFPDSIQLLSIRDDLIN